MVASDFRFAAVISHPIQHYSPMFRTLAGVPGMQVKVFYLCDHGVRETYDTGFGQTFKWDVPLLDGYDYEILRPGFCPSRFGFSEVDSPDLPAALARFAPHAIWLHGYGQRISWRALSWAQERAAVIYFGDSELLRSRSRRARALKRVILPYFFSRCDAFITAGDNNEAYYRHYGVEECKLIRGACPIDVDRFATYARSSTLELRGEVRKALGLPPDALVAVFSGKLEPGKRPLDLVEAIAILAARGLRMHALFIGDGVQRGIAEARARELGVADRIVFTGFINQSRIPELLHASDILAMTSERDAHPLAVTESLVFGHPIVVSDRVGCVGPTDTARPGDNAILYPCGDILALAESLARLEQDPEAFRRMSEASRSIAPSQDIKVTVHALLTALLGLRGRFAKPWGTVNDSVFELWERARV